MPTTTLYPAPSSLETNRSKRDIRSASVLGKDVSPRLAPHFALTLPMPNAASPLFVRVSAYWTSRDRSSAARATSRRRVTSGRTFEKGLRGVPREPGRVRRDRRKTATVKDPSPTTVATAAARGRVSKDPISRGDVTMRPGLMRPASGRSLGLMPHHRRKLLGNPSANAVGSLLIVAAVGGLFLDKEMKILGRVAASRGVSTFPEDRRSP